MLVAIAHDDAFVMGVLSSRIHIMWALAQGGTLEDRPRYNKTRCFETFPFPDASELQKETIRELAERLDAFRKARLAEHPNLDHDQYVQRAGRGAGGSGAERQE